MWNILKQLPRLIETVRAEHSWLKDFTANNAVDGIISDNRYGLYHSSVPAVILTHQPGLVSGMGSFCDSLLRRIHYSFLARFKAVWLVDNECRDNLSGELAHPAVLPPNAKYIGLLSQMTPNVSEKKKDHLLVLLSGPEPQRTILQDILWNEVCAYQGKAIFIAGKINGFIPEHIPSHVQYHQHLTADELQPLLENASYIISRSGYSTLMDLAVVQKKALLIPTPGQTEQEYLARHLHDSGIFPRFEQERFSLKDALVRARDFPFHPLAANAVNDQMKEVLDEWLAKI